MTSLSKRALCLAAAVFASAFVLLAFAVAWAAPPASTTLVSQPEPPSSMFEEVWDEPVSRTAIKVCWGGDGIGGGRYLDGAQSGRDCTHPARDAAPVATLKGGHDAQCHLAKGLVLDAPYTFAITGRNEAGEGSEVGTVTAASREAGLFVARGRSRGQLPGSAEHGTVALAPGRSAAEGVQAAYFMWPPGRVLPGLYHSTATGVRTWSRPQLLGKHPEDGTRPQIATNENGAVVVAWNGSFNSPQPAYRYLPAGETQWGRVSQLSRRLGDLVDAATVDRAGRLHFLVRRGQRGTVVYRTNAAGRWTEMRIPRTICPAEGCEYFRPLMTYDPVANRIVVVVQKRRELRIAAKRPDASAFRRFHRLPGTNGRQLRATALTSHGQITIALVDVGSTARLYLMSGREPNRVGRLTKIPGTTLRDTQYARYSPYSPGDESFYVAAVDRDRVVFAWQRDHWWARSWDPQQQGIWVRTRKRDPTSGRWRFGPASHRTASAYDGLASLTIGAGGRAYFAYRR